ncbi:MULTISPECIES: DUF927 domain-containing protein [unclassified Mesorhizobium]|uniref:DUF927 domain-containing protein n=1 Tax=unclassified Mesorhizobium TaxID=325217 RepID=UPI00333835CC
MKTNANYNRIKAKNASKRRPTKTAVCGVRGVRSASHAPSVRRVADAVTVVAAIENIDTGTFKIELAFSDCTGEPKRCEVERSMLGDPRAITRFLLDRGAIFPTGTDFPSLMSAAKRHRRVTSRIGWHGTDTFVLPRATIGKDLALIYAGSATGTRGMTAGTLPKWKSSLSDLLSRSSYLTFGVALAFAAPLAALLDLEETAAFHLFGESNSGKTLVAKVANSVTGRARERDLVGFDQADAALNDVMFDHHSTLLVMNEMKTDSGGAARTLPKLSHTLTSGLGRNRSEFASRDRSLQLRHWCIFGLTTMEKSLENLTNNARDNGERARHIDVPVPPRDQGGIFDRLGGGGQIGDDARAMAELVVTAINDNYGVAFPPFVESIMASRDKTLKRFQRNVAMFVDRCAISDDAWERRIAIKFGYVYAAGIAAIRAGVLPCTRAQMVYSCRKLYRVSRRSLTAIETEVKVDMEVFRKMVCDDKRVPRIENGNVAPEGFETCLGFRRRLDLHGDVACLRPVELKKVMGSEAKYRELLSILKSKNAIVGCSNKTPTTAREVKGCGRSRYLTLKIASLDPAL